MCINTGFYLFQLSVQLIIEKRKLYLPSTLTVRLNSFLVFISLNPTQLLPPSLYSLPSFYLYPFSLSFSDEEVDSEAIARRRFVAVQFAPVGIAGAVSFSEIRVFPDDKAEIRVGWSAGGAPSGLRGRGNGEVCGKRGASEPPRLRSPPE